MNHVPSTTIGRRIGLGLLTLVAVFTAVSPYLADWNHTHIYNPNWPPHAKFHNAQTMSMAVIVAIGTLFFAWRRRGDASTNLIAAAAFASTYWASQAIAFAFPGVDYVDPEFRSSMPQPIAGLAPQQVVEIVALALVALATALMASGIRHARTSGPTANHVPSDPSRPATSR